MFRRAVVRLMRHRRGRGIWLVESDSVACLGCEFDARAFGVSIVPVVCVALDVPLPCEVCDRRVVLTPFVLAVAHSGRAV